MRRLPFQLHDFTRIAWTSAPAREKWEGEAQRFGEAWERIERAAVLAGIREAALQMCQPDALPSLSTWAAGAGLAVIPLAQLAQSGTYSSGSSPAVPGKPWGYRIVVARPERAAAAVAAWQDDEAMGRLLGYPACCRTFFRLWWAERGYRDTTWQAADGGADGPPEANILLRWFGVRLVSHLPCSFRCEESARIGRAMADIGRELGHGAEVDAAFRMLSWPVEWDALHGIAEVRTPVARAITRTDAMPHRVVVQRAGTEYPDEGARGLRFPFRSGRSAPLPRPGGIPPRAKVVQDRSTDNGFPTLASQERAHAVVAAAAAKAPSGDVLDLGCGNGSLAVRIAEGRGGSALGVEMDPARAAAARWRLGPDALVEGSLADAWPGRAPYALVLLMPGRLVEAGDKAAELRSRLADQAAAVLIYAYDDWLTPGGLSGLARRAGLGDWEVLENRSGEGVEAALIAPPPKP